MSDAQLGQPSSKPALGKRTHEEMGVDFVREEESPERTSREKKTRKDDKSVEDKTSKDDQSYTLADPGSAPLKLLPRTLNLCRYLMLRRRYVQPSFNFFQGMQTFLI